MFDYQIDKLYRQAFPSLADSALFKLEGAKDAIRNQASDKLGLGFKIDDNKAKNDLISFKGVESITDTSFLPTNYLGLPIFQQITFVGADYRYIENGEIKSKALNTIHLPSTSTCEFNREKDIIKTEINGNGGTVKELWGFNDWKITIRGLIISEYKGTKSSFIFPEEELKALLDYESVGDSIEVAGGLFMEKYLNIKRITIDSIKIGKMIGFPNVVPFTIQAESDTAIEIEITNNRLN